MRVQTVEFGGAEVADAVEDDGIVVERMAGDVDAYEVALFVEPLHGAPFCIDLRRLRFRDFDFGDVVKQGGGGVGFVGLIVLAVGNEFVEEEITVFAGGEELFATDGTEPVEGTGEGQTFNAFLIAGKEIDSLDEVVDRLVGAVFLSFGEDGINGCFSDSLTAPRPKRISPRALTLNLTQLSLMSGPRVLMPIDLLSSISLVMVLMSARLRLMTPAIYWAG